jgi:endonuclease-3 related protein
MNKIEQIYHKLLEMYGPQGWWPLTVDGFHSKHYMGKPKSFKHRFEIIVGAICTQNTNWKNVEKALYNLSKNKLLDIDKIRKADVSKLGDLIRPAGYYNQKAERLKIIAEFFSKNKDPSREELLAVKGIGPETADSILLYAFEKLSFVVDAYTRRIFSNLGLIQIEDSYDSIKHIFENNLPKDLEMYKEYHALIVEHAKRYYRKKPYEDPLKSNIL